jgi:hypothetical protein
MNYNEKRAELVAQKMKLDKFFTMYLDKFDKQMNPENPNTPVWKLYRTKSDEYTKVCQELRNTDYWINKHV